MTNEAREGAGLAIERGTRLADRFVIRAQIGAGAFGVVYAAEDVTDGRVVAIKRLTRVTGATIYRFKREFRAVADREHPNLVRLHELFSVDDDWFFSMELVDGVPFDSHVLGPTHRSLPAPTEPDGRAPASPADTRAIERPDLDKLRAALRQLVAAVRALHGTGVVHRDLKPGNVLVTSEGRVVVLDFGLSTESDPDAQKSVLGLVMGTPTYMSPEQALGRATTEAADWYSVGVMLYEALYGRLPFSGTVHDMLTTKLSPSTWRWPAPWPGAQDLHDLCRALLHPDAEQRPTGDTIAALVDAHSAAAPVSVATKARSSFVGRARELGVLKDALDGVDSSHAVVLHVHGQSGVGKTALIKEFVHGLGRDVVTLQGRCYERESVPYKALDGIVDSLTRYLARLSVEEASLLVPREAQALCRLFPVAARLRLLAEQPERHRSSSPIEERRRGFAALREVLARIGDRRRLVVTIDDLQWGDLDSVEPIAELLRDADPPRLLLVLSYRSSDAPYSAVLQALRATPFSGAAFDVRDLEVGPLGDEDALALAESLLPEGERAGAAQLAKESGGIPFLVPELVRAQRIAPGAAVSFEQAMQRRVSELPDGARRLLEVVAVAGRPVSRIVAFAAARLEDAERDSAVRDLAREHFIRSAADEDSSLETFHDRVREGVVSTLSEDQRRATHEALARVLAAAETTDPEALAEHLRLAGKLSEARPVAIQAAERAAHAYAFERAVALYRVAQEGAPSSERRLLTSKLADVLAYAGRGREAAAAFLEAVEGASPKEARELKRRAAEQLFRSGAIQEGIALSRSLLKDAGVSFPEGRGASIAAVAIQKIRLGMRGFEFKERTLGPEDDDDKFRVDLLYSVGAALRTIEIIRGAYLQTRQVRDALDLGDPARAARGLSLVATSVGSEGKPGTSQKAADLAQRAIDLARRIDDPHAIASSYGTLAALAWFAGRWRLSLEYIHELRVVIRERCPERVWELPPAEIFVGMRSMFSLGLLEEMEAEVMRCTRSATERGDDVVLAMAQAVGLSRVHLIHDRPSQARDVSAKGIAHYAGGAWNLAHQEGLRAELTCSLYEGDAARALARIAETSKAVKDSLLMHSQLERTQSYALYAAASILVRDATAAEKWLKLLKREDLTWARAYAQALDAALLALRGSPDAPAQYEAAASQFDALEMPLYAAAARRRRALLEGGADGEALRAASDAVLTTRGIADPEAFARTLVV